MAVGTFQQIIDSLARDALAAFELAKAVGHPGEGGRAREQTVARFLRQVVPPGFELDTGFVIDAKGDKSRQIDIVVHRVGHYPVLDIGGVKHFMVESVEAVIEVKARIDSTAVLHDALDTVASVRRLDRSNDGENRTTTGRDVDPSDILHQVWGAVVTGASLEQKRCRESIADWLDNHPRREWPCAYLDVDRFLVEYLVLEGRFPRARTSNPMIANGLATQAGITRRWGWSPPLAAFAVDLLDILRASPTIDFSPSGYFSRVMVPADSEYIVLDHPQS